MLQGDGGLLVRKGEHVRNSDNALVTMRQALDDDGIDMRAVWDEHGPRRGSKDQASRG